MTNATHKHVVIAIDGPAASGKGTLARKLAHYFDYAHLDTGALYRGIGLAILRAGGNPASREQAIAVLGDIGNMDLTDPAIKNESTGNAASKVAAFNEVREALLNFQREFATTPPGHKEGAVLDGRDIGTVICPNANAKIFIVAEVETRAKRRVLEEYGPNHTVEQYEKILADLKERDARDKTRAQAPLSAAKDAYLLDTTNSDIETVFEKALSYISSKI